MTATSRMAAMARDLARKYLPERCDRSFDDPGVLLGRIDFVVAPQMEVGKPTQDRNDFLAIVFHHDVAECTRRVGKDDAFLIGGYMEGHAKISGMDCRDEVSEQ